MRYVQKTHTHAGDCKNEADYAGQSSGVEDIWEKTSPNSTWSVFLTTHSIVSELTNGLIYYIMLVVNG